MKQTEDEKQKEVVQMADFWIALILIILVGAALAYIIKAKKSGVKCIGCPSGGTCGKKNCGGCSCGEKE